MTVDEIIIGNAPPTVPTTRREFVIIAQITTYVESRKKRKKTIAFYRINYDLTV